MLVAIGCSSKDDGAGDTGSTGGGDPQMCVALPQATADFDEVDFYVRGTVDFKFTKDKDEEATVTLTDASATVAARQSGSATQSASHPTRPWQPVAPTRPRSPTAVARLLSPSAPPTSAARSTRS